MSSHQPAVCCRTHAMASDPTPAATAQDALAQAFDEAKRGNAGTVWWQDIIRTPSWRALAAAVGVTTPPMTTDPTPAATARDALLCEVSVLRPDGERQYCVHKEPCPDHAEAPGRVAALEAALLDIGTERDMAHAYYPTLERHLREHGCTHNFADVAEANGTLAAPAPTAGVSGEGTMPGGASLAWHSEHHGPDTLCRGCRDHIGWHMLQCRCKEAPWCVPHPSDEAHQWASLCRLPHEHVAAPAPTPSDPVDMPSGKCPACWSDGAFRLPPDWQDRVERGQAIPIVGCGDPWHYAAPAPTPSEPVGRCAFVDDDGMLCLAPLDERWHRHDGSCRWGKAADHVPDAACHPFTPGARDE